jgi:toxin ParE1/3/4
MSWRVQFAPEARDQLQALLAYISEQASVTVAERYTEAVISTCEKLAWFPMRGVPRDDIRSGLRLTHHRRRTVIAYAVDEASGTVSILGIFHGGQDHEAKLGSTA